MATQVIMPKLSPTMEEGQISRWLKKEGDKVSMGEPLAEIDTDKATMEMQALANGVLRKILINEGESAPLGQLIAIIGEPDEDISALTAQPVRSNRPRPALLLSHRKNQKKPVPDRLPFQKLAIPSVAVEASGNGSQKTAQTEASSSGRLIVSPLAARMAAESGIDLRSVSGSGPGGRIIKRDVEQLISGKSTTASAQPPTRHLRAVETSPFQKSATAQASAYRDEPASEMRRTIAKRL